MHIRNSLWICLLFALCTDVRPTTSINRAVLIFLNDSESDAAAGAKKIGAISIAFSLALVQQAGPIIVSASILDNMRQRENPADTSFSGLIERFNILQSKFNELNDTEIMELKNIYRYLLPFNQDTTDLFIIKKISAELYLVIPKKYLNSLNIDAKEVELHTNAPMLTKIERLLGMKVNHMQMITDINEIKKPLPIPPFAHYFIGALHNKEKSIFITNNEYHAHNDKNIPLWSIYITGHGTMGGKITALSIDQFKDFLIFLEHRIHTKLLYYLSCYAAGVNHEALYKDIENGIKKTYPFAVITQAITDASIVLHDIELTIENGNPIIGYSQRYRRFVELLITFEMIDYKAIAACFDTFLEVAGIGSMLPQVKLPGLPWFSTIHEDRVCSIGSILAKTRTNPLNIETFFARQGKKAAPIGILLYSSNIPFELIINSKTTVDLPPTIVSMIPGDAVHHIKKISSSVHTVKNLLTSFFQIENLSAKKFFVIDDLVGSDVPIGVRNVVVEVTPQKNTVYYMHNDVLYKDMEEQTTDADATRYKKLLALPQRPKDAVTKDVTSHTPVPPQTTMPERKNEGQISTPALPASHVASNAPQVKQKKVRNYRGKVRHKKRHNRRARKCSK